jgi:DNA-binding FrmR family transcriptional regulator
MHKFPDIHARLKRASGHLLGVIEMLEQERSCMDIAQQLHAVEKAVGNAKKALIKEHIHHCLDGSSDALSRQMRELLKEFQSITKYL